MIRAPLPQPTPGVDHQPTNHPLSLFPSAVVFGELQEEGGDASVCPVTVESGAILIEMADAGLSLRLFGKCKWGVATKFFWKKSGYKPPVTFLKKFTRCSFKIFKRTKNAKKKCTKNAHKICPDFTIFMDTNFYGIKYVVERQMGRDGRAIFPPSFLDVAATGNLPPSIRREEKHKIREN